MAKMDLSYNSKIYSNCLWFISDFWTYVLTENRMLGDPIILIFIDDYHMPTGITGRYPFFHFQEDLDIGDETYLKLKYDATKIKISR